MKLGLEYRRASLSRRSAGHVRRRCADMSCGGRTPLEHDAQRRGQRSAGEAPPARRFYTQGGCLVAVASRVSGPSRMPMGSVEMPRLVWRRFAASQAGASRAECVPSRGMAHRWEPGGRGDDLCGALKPRASTVPGCACLDITFGTWAASRLENASGALPTLMPQTLMRQQGTKGR